MENYHLSIDMAFWKESMINRVSNLINRNRSAAKISQVLCSSKYTKHVMIYPNIAHFRLYWLQQISSLGNAIAYLAKTATLKMSSKLGKAG